MPFVTSHVEVAERDRTINGLAIGKGQAYIVSDKNVSSGASEIDICKIAQYVDGLLECVPLGDDLGGLAGTDGQLFEGFDLFGSGTADFIVNGVVAGDHLIISSGSQQGTYQILSINSNDAVNLDTTFKDTEADLSWSLVRNERPPDYSKVLRALPVPAGGLLPQMRYFPLLGPGDHAGDQGSTIEGLASLQDSTANFSDVLRPIPTDGTAYVEILSGADTGFHNIVTVFDQLLVLSVALTATANNIKYRIRLVSPHATQVMVSDWGSDKVAIPIQDSFEVKIASAIRNLADAQALDVASEIPKTTRAVDLFEVLGPFLGCYRLEREASETQGVPLDKRVLIPAKPWRGHDVDGVLFFDAQDPPQQKYDLSDADEPVIPIRWFRDSWRLELAIARVVLPAPEEEELCGEGQP